MTTTQLIDKALIEAEKVTGETESNFLSLSKIQLNWKPDRDTWGIGECFQHLLLSNEKYIPGLRNASGKKSSKTENIKFKHSLTGKLIMKSVKPDAKFKMKTTKEMTPDAAHINPDIVKDFLNQHKLITELINNCRNVDLQNIKIKSPFFNWMKYNLGDTVLIIMYHNQRHIKQAENIMRLDLFPH